MNPALVNVASRGFRYPEQYRVQYTGTYTDARNNTERATLVAFAKCAHEPNIVSPSTRRHPKDHHGTVSNYTVQ